MKRTIKTYFKFFAFLFGISLLLVNCEKEHFEKITIESTKSPYTQKRVRLSEIPSIKNQLSEGAAFFVLGNNKAKAITEIRSVEILEFSDLSECILAFLEKNNVSENTTLKGFVGFNLQPKSEINLPFETLCYTDFCGRFFTSSSFGTHLASSHLMANANSGDSALVINLVSEKQVALTLLQRV